MPILLKPQVRSSTELPYHSNSISVKRFIFVDKSLYPESAFYITGRKINHDSQLQLSYIEEHRHNCNSFYVFVGHGHDLTGLTAEAHIGEKGFIVKSPSTVMIPPLSLHKCKLTGGKGWFFHIILKGSYSESSTSDKGTFMPLSDTQTHESEERFSCQKIYKPTSLNIDDFYKSAKIEDDFKTLVDENSRLNKWTLVHSELFKNPGICLTIHDICTKNPHNYQVKLHKHNLDEVYLILGNCKKNLVTGIFDINGEIKVQSPATIYNPPNSHHKCGNIIGDGLILVIRKEDI